jgi:hypothetical protein
MLLLEFHCAERKREKVTWDMGLILKTNEATSPRPLFGRLRRLFGVYLRLQRNIKLSFWQTIEAYFQK